MPDSSHPRDSPSGDGDRSSPHPQRLRTTALPPLRAAAFWSAVVLPFLYLPLLVYGLSTTTQASVFLLLVVLHVMALVLGRSYASS